jgi:hypothetical protein
MIDQQPASGAVPGSGAMTQRERELTARIHTIVTVDANTILVKVLAPNALARYMRREVSPGVWGKEPPFDYRIVGGTVARMVDVAELHTPAEFLRAFRLDFPGSPFTPRLPMLYVMELATVDPSLVVLPLGAPAPPFPQKGYPPNMSDVRVTAQRMVDAAKQAGVDPNSYRVELNPWPYTGTGITADAELGVPERWRRYAPVPPGAAIVGYDQAGNKRPVAIYRGPVAGWEALQ